MVTQAERDRRFRERAKPKDSRTEAQRDTDRILYASAFRRLGGVTQVVLAEEGHLFHNRLTHSMKVAQVGKRIAQKLLDDISGITDERDAVLAAGGLDPDTVEAASLAHDLGHPPFGHIGENELNKSVQRLGLKDGFEGNAQSFRVVTKLAVASAPPPEKDQRPGLNLTSATLNAILKYPWLRRTGDRKWGAYYSERDEFDWATQPLGLPDTRTLEADIMDWADDITYGVHDVEDFYRAGFIPLAELAALPPHQFPQLQMVRDTLRARGQEIPADDDLFGAVAATVRMFSAESPRFSGTRSERRRLREFTSMLIGRYVNATTLDRGTLVTPEEYRIQVEVLKSLTRAYVVGDPAIVTQQVGEKRIVRELFDIYWDSLFQGNLEVFPARLREEVELVSDLGVTQSLAVRFVADAIASMTEEQAVRSHQRLTGVALGPLVESPMK